MGVIKPTRFVKFFVGMLAPQTDRFELAQKLLMARLGAVDFASFHLPWDYTRYYAHELGETLLRHFIFFERCAPPHHIAAIKHQTGAIERQMGLAADGLFRRQINLDPGYLSDSKVVLATTKDFAHRICLQEGIYAEVTLIFQGRSFQPLPHTYPDYRSKEYIELFNQVREIYRRLPESAIP